MQNNSLIFSSHYQKPKEITHKRIRSQLTYKEQLTDRQSQFTSKRTNTNHYRKQSLDFQSKTYDQTSQLEKEQQQLLKSISILLNSNQQITKHQTIRVQHWLNKLSIKQKNIVWKKNVIFYLKVLHYMIQVNQLVQPFHKIPQCGTLPKLSIFDIAYPIRNHFQTEKHTKERQSSNGNSIAKKIQDKYVSISQNRNFSIQKSIMDNTSVLMKSVNISNIIHNKKDDFDIQQFKNSLKSSTISKPLIVQKARKQKIIKSNKNSAKTKDIATPQNNDWNKQNNPHLANVARCLFSSKQKQTNKQQSYASIYKKKKQSISINQKQHCRQLYQEISNQHERQTSKNRLQSSFCINQASLDESILSQSTGALKKASEKITQKFRSTSRQTKQFMNFLRNLREQKETPINWRMI